MHHRIEDVRTGAGQTVTLSFYAKASTGHTSTIEMAQVFGSGGSSQVTLPAQNYTMTTSWQKFTFTITLPSISGKTIGTSSYVYVSFIRSLSASGVSIDIAQMQLELGSQATPFEHRSFGEELSLCERYFTSLLTSGSGYNMFLHPIDLSNNYRRATLRWPTKMRTSPTVSITGSAFGTMPSGMTTDAINDTFVFINGDVSGSGEYSYVTGLTADAEL